MAQKTENVESIVLAACVLHNILRTRFRPTITNLADREDPETHNVIPGTWRDDERLTGLQALRGNNAAQTAKVVRDYQQAYYSSEAGSVAWQDSMI